MSPRACWFQHPLTTSSFPRLVLFRRQRLKEAVAKGAGKPSEGEAGAGASSQGAAAPTADADAGEGQHIWQREGQEAQMPPPGG